jgi:hypothetical protein
MPQGVGAMLEAVDQKALFDYWHDRVRLKNLPRIGAQEHVPTHKPVRPMASRSRRA